MEHPTNLLTMQECDSFIMFQNKCSQEIWLLLKAGDEWLLITLNKPEINALGNADLPNLQMCYPKNGKETTFLQLNDNISSTYQGLI